MVCNEKRMICEPAKEIPVYGEYDVVVCGGGIAGVSAAIAAARNGARTLLLERAFGLGGLATLGLIVIYLPLCDGKGRQVSFGLAEELFHLSISHGHDFLYPDAWLEEGKEGERAHQRFQVQYNANVYTILLEQKLKEEGVEILYGTTVCDTIPDGNRIKGVYIENKTGRQAVLGGTFVDASGDADLFRMAGEETVINEAGNPLASWYFLNENGKYTLRMYGYCDSVVESDIQKIGNRNYIGVDAKELTEMVMDSHASTLQHFLQGGECSREHALTTIASIPMVRMTRRIAGVEELKKEDVFAYKEDSIGMIGNWKKPGPVYEIPFATLHGSKCVNLIAAGRLTAADDETWDLTRVIPSCAVTGEAAGTAASMFDDFTAVDIERLQMKLKENGVRLHQDELK